jgi:serine/threonine protein kinase
MASLREARQNGQVTSAGFTMSGLLPLRETDPREIGGYRLLGRLGEGGQGVVFLADSPGGGQVAVKLLPPTTDPQVRSRFLKEFAAAQRVARFCTAQVLDAGIFERRPFLVSEYVNGPSLVEVVEQLGPRTGAALERIAVATLTALGAVHAAGMVHRDFKPANVLLGPDGPVVIDFGLATVPGMTTTALSGQVAMGTPAFMSPEQLAGTRVTAAADMWSWGVTIAYAGTGQLPFHGDSLTATAYAILRSDPKVGTLPEPLMSLVHRCLSKDSADRPSAREALGVLVAAGARLVGPMPDMASELVTGETTEDPSAAPTEPRRRGADGGTRGDSASGRRPGRRRTGRVRLTGWRWRAAALVSVVVLLAGAGGLEYALSGSDPSGRSHNHHAGSSESLTTDAAVEAKAITWILNQASRAATVSCDVQVCSDLANRGWPSVLPLPLSATDPLGSELVVATADIRAQFGSQLAVYAPATIASFGSGHSRIDIRWVYPGGAAAYRAQFGLARQARIAADEQLLRNPNIGVSASARAQLERGDVDPLLTLLIAAMATYKPVSIVDFPMKSPGGGPASLRRAADFATVVPGDRLTPSRYVGWMRAFAYAQRAAFRPAWVLPVRLPDGQTVLRIGYGAPSPLSATGG